MYQNFLYPPTDNTLNHTAFYALNELIDSLSTWFTSTYTYIRKRSLSEY